jgi:hypothetical protein
MSQAKRVVDLRRANRPALDMVFSRRHREAMAESKNIPEANAALDALLEPGERVTWAAQPRPYVYIVRGLSSIAYGTTWAVLGAIWYHGSGGVGRNAVFEGWWRLLPLLSLPFILAGLSFFISPIRLGAQARRTWYVVTNRRVFIAELFAHHEPKLRVFSPHELAPPLAVKRMDGLYNLVLTNRAQEGLPHLAPRLEDAFFGLTNTEAASAAVEKCHHR